MGCWHPEQVVWMSVPLFRLVDGRSAHCRRGRRRRRRYNIKLFKAVDGRQIVRQKRETDKIVRRKNVFVEQCSKSAVDRGVVQ